MATSSPRATRGGCRSLCWSFQTDRIRSPLAGTPPRAGLSPLWRNVPECPQSPGGVLLPEPLVTANRGLGTSCPGPRLSPGIPAWRICRGQQLSLFPGPSEQG